MRQLKMVGAAALGVLMLGSGLMASPKGDGFEVTGVRFFEGPLQAPAAQDRRFDTRFLKGSARYIWTQVEMKNLLYQDRDQTHEVLRKYYNPDGSLRGETQSTMVIKSEWATAWNSSGWGWKEAGNWPAGAYRVAVFIDGEKVGDERFTIALSDDYDVESIRLFEGAHEAPAKDSRVYKTRFDAGDARYIWTEVTVKNHQYQVREHTHSVVFKYYNPDGSLRGEVNSSFTVKTEWSTAWKSAAWGWKEAGHWPLGNYHVEILMDGSLIGDRYFTIEGEVNQFPEPERVERSNRADIAWEIANDTDYTITIEYSGPSTGSITIAPRETKTLDLPAGSYSVRGTCAKPGVLPYAGSVEFPSGWKYRNNFFIITR